MFYQTPAQMAAARKQPTMPLPQPQLARPADPSPVGGETIEATGGHPFWVISGEDLDKRPVPEHCPAEVPDAAIPGRWVNACAMRVGDVVLTPDGRRVAILEASVRPARTKVYNLQVEGLGNYAVGHSGILVHNTSNPSNRRNTKHGVKRLVDPTRHLTPAEEAATRASHTLKANNGAAVCIHQAEPGKFNVIVEGQGGFMTRYRHLRIQDVRRMAIKYGWRAP